MIRSEEELKKHQEAFREKQEVRDEKENSKNGIPVDPKIKKTGRKEKDLVLREKGTIILPEEVRGILHSEGSLQKKNNRNKVRNRRAFYSREKR